MRLSAAQEVNCAFGAREAPLVDSPCSHVYSVWISVGGKAADGYRMRAENILPTHMSPAKMISFVLPQRRRKENEAIF